MRFRTAPLTHRIPNNVLVYRPEEFSFAVEPPANCSGRSILVNDLNLELDDDDRVIAVWGMCPHTRWTNMSLTPPPANFGEVFASLDAPLPRGVSTRLNSQRRWPVFADPFSGWVRITGEEPAATAAKVAAGMILEFDSEGNLNSLWLRPKDFPPVFQN
jgi:hypothetical protein